MTIGVGSVQHTIQSSQLGVIIQSAHDREPNQVEKFNTQNKQQQRKIRSKQQV
jgi:hypothetical protein